jgi:hypothetical protein
MIKESESLYDFIAEAFQDSTNNTRINLLNFDFSVLMMCVDLSLIQYRDGRDSHKTRLGLFSSKHFIDKWTLTMCKVEGKILDINQSSNKPEFIEKKGGMCSMQVTSVWLLVQSRE